MANHLEFGSIAVGAPASVARLRAEVADTIKGLNQARGILDPYFDPSDPNDWAGKVDDILKRAIKQLSV